MDTLIDLGSRGSLERSYNLSTIINTPTTTYTPQDKNIKSYEFWLNLIRIWINQFLFLRWQEERWQYSQGQSMTGHLSLRFCMFVCYDFIILKSLICFFFFKLLICSLPSFMPLDQSFVEYLDSWQEEKLPEDVWSSLLSRNWIPPWASYI